MQAGPRISVHIGLPKTGTTFLQRVVFRRHPDLAYLGKNGADEALDAGVAAIAQLGSATFRFDEVRADFRRAIEAAAGRPVLVSEERYASYARLDPELIAGRLNAVLGRYQPIYVIRRPLDWLQSMYFFRLSTLQADALRGPQHWLEVNLAERRLGSDTLNLHYGRVAAAYRRMSGTDSIGVLCYEDLKQDRAAYLRTLSRLIGVPAPPTLQLAKVAPTNKRRDKQRMSSRQAGFLQGCLLLLEGSVQAFRRHVEQALAELPADAKSTPAAAAAAEAALRDGRECLEDWAPAIHRIARALGAVDGPPAEFEAAPELKREITQLMRRQVELCPELPAARCRAHAYF